MRIAIISTLESVPWTGCEELWAATAELALDAGDEVVCSVCRWPTVPPKLEALERRGAKVVRRPRKRMPSLDGFATRVALRPVRLPRPAWLDSTSLFRGIFSANPDVVLLNQAGTYDYYQRKELCAWLLRNPAPYVIVNHLNFDYFIPESRHFEEGQTFFGGAAHVGFVSRHNLEAAERQLGWRFSNASVVQNPVNLQEASIAPWRAGDELRLAFVGRLECNHKGQDLLLHALSGAKWRDRAWRLTLYGSGPDEAYLRRLVGLYNLGAHVHFAGQISDVRLVWSDNHLCLLSSRFEGTPLALIEGMLCGRAALVTDVGGNAEWVEDGVSGYVSPGATAESLAATLERAWEDRANWQTRGVAAYETASRRVDRQPAKSLLRILQSAVENRGRVRVRAGGIEVLRPS